jgi:hypothetical protein
VGEVIFFDEPQRTQRTQRKRRREEEIEGKGRDLQVILFLFDSELYHVKCCRGGFAEIFDKYRRIV